MLSLSPPVVNEEYHSGKRAISQTYANGSGTRYASRRSAHPRESRPACDRVMHSARLRSIRLARGTGTFEATDKSPVVCDLGASRPLNTASNQPRPHGPSPRAGWIFIQDADHAHACHPARCSSHAARPSRAFPILRTHAEKNASASIYRLCMTVRLALHTPRGTPRLPARDCLSGFIRRRMHAGRVTIVHSAGDDSACGAIRCVTDAVKIPRH